MPRKYSLQEDFFSRWNPDSAYTYGFWLADGSMRVSRSYRIYFSSADKQILDDINKALSSSAFVSQDTRSRCHLLVIHSKTMYLDISSLGGHPAKSITMVFPKIPKSLLRDLIRGYFDGDGSVHYISYVTKKNHKKYTEIRSNFTSGSPSFLEKLRKVLEKEVGVKKRVIGQYGPHQFKLGYGKTDTKKLLNYMYYPSHNLSLKRKAVFF